MRNCPRNCMCAECRRYVELLESMRAFGQPPPAAMTHPTNAGPDEAVERANKAYEDRVFARAMAICEGASRDPDPYSPMRNALEVVGYFALRDERDRLRQIEHMVWHVLNESGDDGETISFDRSDPNYAQLNELLTEDHPEDAPPHRIPDAYKSLAQRADKAESALAAERETVQSLLGLVADIRSAAGDPTGKLMQDELVAHIADERERAEANARDARRWRWFRNAFKGGYFVAAQGLFWNLGRGSRKELDAAVDAALTQEGKGKS